MTIYDKDYYECGIESGKSCYNNYRWIPELTIPMASRIIEHLKISEDDKVLDYGCAKGFVVKAFRLLGKQCWGYDISEYAIESAPTEVKPWVTSDIDKVDYSFDWIIAKDVLEHVSYDDIDDVLGWFYNKAPNVFIVVPLGNGSVYNVPAYELDKTHIIRENIDWWTDKIKSVGYDTVNFSYQMLGLKENWNHYKKGNGFFIGRSNGEN